MRSERKGARILSAIATSRPQGTVLNKRRMRSPATRNSATRWTSTLKIIRNEQALWLSRCLVTMQHNAHRPFYFYVKMEQMPTDEDYFEKQLKMVVIGEPSTGKYYPTYGVDFMLQRHEIRNGKNVTLIIWDISGQSLTTTMMENYLYAANIVLLVFDITNAASFQKLSEWLAVVKSTYFETKPIIAIIANKSDMEHQRAVSVEKQVKFANEHGFTSHTVSARTGENKICAEKLGLKLTRVEQEAHQTVVRAEILAPNQNQVYPTYQPTSSTVCSVQ